jgi:hypothetical protein
MQDQADQEQAVPEHGQDLAHVPDLVDRLGPAALGDHAPEARAAAHHRLAKRRVHSALPPAEDVADVRNIRRPKKAQ